MKDNPDRDDSPKEHESRTQRQVRTMSLAVLRTVHDPDGGLRMTESERVFIVAVGVVVVRV